VYSRATTSAMALRWVLPEAFLVEDISAALLAAIRSREASRNCAKQEGRLPAIEANVAGGVRTDGDRLWVSRR
jgi:hypothetical protein